MTTTTAVTTEVEKKKRAPRGQGLQLRRTGYLVFTVVDGDGNTIPNANVKVEAVTRKAEEAIGLVEKGFRFIKVEV